MNRKKMNRHKKADGKMAEMTVSERRQYNAGNGI